MKSFYGVDVEAPDNRTNDPKVFIKDAFLTIAHDKFAKEEFRKLLEAMLIHAPTEKGQAYIAKDIVKLRTITEKYYQGMVASAKHDELLSDCFGELSKSLNRLAEHLTGAVILPIMNGAREDVRPNPVVLDNENKEVEPATRDSKNEIIARESYMCCATARLDIELALREKKERDKILKGKIYTAGGYDTLLVAHVIPFSLNNFDPAKSKQKIRAKRIWTALEGFSGMDLSALKGKGINDNHNLFALSPVAHKLYDDLLLSFAPSPDKKGMHRAVARGDRAKLVSVCGDVKLPVKSEWLAIHYAIYNIVYAAGLNDEMRKIADAERKRLEAARYESGEMEIEEEEEEDY